jgi:hypothetical protein
LEDQILVEKIAEHGTGTWSLIAAWIPCRTGKQCRERWLNQISPELTPTPWSPQEDFILMQAQSSLGHAWSKIAQYLPGRSSNSIKNRWSWLSNHSMAPIAPALRMQFPSIQPSFDEPFILRPLFPEQIGPSDAMAMPVLSRVQGGRDKPSGGF